MRYEIFGHSVNIDGEEITTYGIVCYVDNTEAVRVYDVSTDFNSLSKLIESANASHLDPLKLGQTLEKYFNEH
ncbi:MAG: hypothetical protein J6Q50_05140 [Clostridia bacterium]|nr:hypothetical protein [Clostridia bacterium]